MIAQKFIEQFNKYGGLELIKQYHKAGVLGFASTEMLRLGTSKTALELLRSSVQFKTQKRLYKKYRYVLNKKEYIDYPIEDKDIPIQSSKRIWICWLQGVENSPQIVQKCVKSIQVSFPDYEIVIINNQNYREYVTFPLFIEEKIKSGIITRTHFSDLLRLELLLRYGGIWMDATVYVTGGNISSQILDADLFMFQELKPGCDGHCMPMSSWFMVSKPNNKILYLTRALLYEYWKSEKEMIDYFLLHHFLNISRELYSDEWSKIPKYSNGDTHILLLELFRQFDKERFDEIKRITSIHKLSYKFTDEQINKQGTYFEKIFREKNNETGINNTRDTKDIT